MIEYKIITPPELKTVKRLWRKFLRHDSHWHFALEMGYIELRVTPYHPQIDAYLKKQKIQFTKRFYRNNTTITRKYQACFDDVYHGYAMLAMKLPSLKYGNMKYQDSYRVVERCIHLIFNNIVWGLKMGHERDILWLILADRTYQAGYNKGSGLT